ncbi:hypothetical protein HNH97_00935 [Gluconacetobacter entanii]|uniref:Uncharacterized protein n=2 Tax=Gluconacetobacter entanii TaxID=108528 RepID=A0A318Q9L6_9PROT|nr:hypothetical protein [Gluconacetobacter entanii]PYD62597.1 hypothetical protein CFR72_11545 [Gluconacetobacter entanii]
MMAGIVSCWAALLLLLAVELLLSAAGANWGIGGCAGLMALLVAYGFMRITRAPALATIFALGGLFWLSILLALGSLDSFTRTNFPVGDTLSSTARNPRTPPDTAP